MNSPRTASDAAGGSEAGVSEAGGSEAGGSGPERAPIRVRLDELLAEQQLTLTELSARVDITIANLSILKNGRARAIRFSTLASLCEVLQCQPGDLLSYPGREDPGR